MIKFQGTTIIFSTRHNRHGHTYDTGKVYIQLRQTTFPLHSILEIKACGVSVHPCVYKDQATVSILN